MVKAIDENISNIDENTTKKLIKEQNYETDGKLNEDHECGVSYIRGKFMQRLASKKLFVLVHGMSGMVHLSTFAYFNGIITTLEKRYRIPSGRIGIIAVGVDISSLFMAPILGHVLARSHRPRWVAASTCLYATFCFAHILLHFFTGPGENSLKLTSEYGSTLGTNLTNFYLENEKLNSLCRLDAKSEAECESADGTIGPQICLFLLHLACGLFGNIYDSLGTAFMDDNIQKSKVPIYISLSLFFRMLGPVLGFSMALFSLKHYIAPNLTPTITILDPRWIGAWWMGYLILGCIALFVTVLLLLFPKELPRAAIRRQISERIKKQERRKQSATNEEKLIESVSKSKDEKKRFSLSKIIATYKRILSIKVVKYNLISSISFMLGFIPFTFFTPKFIETQFRQSAAIASFLSGSIGFVFLSFGTIFGGLILKNFKPSGRQIAGYNVFTNFLAALSILSITAISCAGNQKGIVVTQPVGINGSDTCISHCQCDFVKYAPICGEDGLTYISPCHAGCTSQDSFKGQKYYDNCACIKSPRHNYSEDHNKELKLFRSYAPSGGAAIDGSCAVDCQNALIYFMIVICTNYFLIASSKTLSLLLIVRSVEPDDKSALLSLGFTGTSLFAMIPGPIITGWILDQTCIVWGKTCAGNGNCWLYEGETMRNLMCCYTSTLVFFATSMEVGIFRNAKGLIIFGDNDKEMTNKINQIEIEEKKERENSNNFLLDTTQSEAKN